MHKEYISADTPPLQRVSSVLSRLHTSILFACKELFILMVKEGALITAAHVKYSERSPFDVD